MQFDRLKRREFVGLVGGVLGWSSITGAQQPKHVARIGFLSTEPPGTQGGSVDAFRQGLRDIGYMEGKDIFVEYRTADGRVERFQELATELVGMGVEIIVATNSLAGRAVQQATATIPIVVPVMGDPIGDGLVASLAQGGGNITGFTFLGPELLPKRLSILKEALPSVSRVAALWHPRAYGERTMSKMMKEMEVAARSLGLQLKLVAVQGPDELDGAFTTIAEERADALLIFPSPMLFAERTKIVELATNRRVPLVAMGREFAELGGLIAYGASIFDLIYRSASYVDKIINGAKPADLPIEQPTKFELIINLKTAKALGLEVPASLLARADEVIE